MEYLWITVALLLIGTTMSLIIYVIIDIIKVKNYYKYCKEKIKIGDRYKEIQVYSRNPFDNPLEDRWVKIVDIKDNQVGETWVKYLVDGRNVPSTELFEEFCDNFEIED